MVPKALYNNRRRVYLVLLYKGGTSATCTVTNYLLDDDMLFAMSAEIDLDEEVECAVCGETSPAREMFITDRIVHPDCSEPADRII